MDVTRENAMLLQNFADLIAANLVRGSVSSQYCDLVDHDCFLIDLECTTKSDNVLKMVDQEQDQEEEEEPDVEPEEEDKLKQVDEVVGLMRGSKMKMNKNNEEDSDKIYNDKIKNNKDGSANNNFHEDKKDPGNEGADFGKVLFCNRMAKTTFRFFEDEQMFSSVSRRTSRTKMQMYPPRPPDKMTKNNTLAEKFHGAFAPPITTMEVDHDEEISESQSVALNTEKTVKV